MVINEMFDRVVVINLDRRPDRLSKITKQLDGLGIAFDRFSAVEDGNAIESCKKSHQAVLSKAREDGLGSILILEDDALFGDNFLSEFEKMRGELPDNWDMLYLGGTIMNKELYSDRLIRSIRTLSLHAYAVNSKAFDILIKDSTGHIDWTYAFLHTQIKAYVCSPALIKTYPSYSDIRLKDVDDTHIFK
jgi:GR25 family glycosyltransferase involved in LPS biosynthesis